MQFSHLFFPISNIFLSKETLQYKETYEEGTSYFYYTRHLGSETTLTWDTKQLPKDRLPHIQYCFVIKRKGNKKKHLKNEQINRKKPLLLSKKKKKKKIPLSTLPAPECYSIIHQHNRNTEMINVVTALLTGQKDREKFDCILYNSTSKYRGGNARSRTHSLSLYLLSAN